MPLQVTQVQHLPKEI
jgi:hypothetical protein